MLKVVVKIYGKIYPIDCMFSKITSMKLVTISAINHWRILKKINDMTIIVGHIKCKIQFIFGATFTSVKYT